MGPSASRDANSSPGRRAEGDSSKKNVTATYRSGEIIPQWAGVPRPLFARSSTLDVPCRHNVYRADEEQRMADKSPRQHQSKKSGKSLKEKRGEKKAKQAKKRGVL